MAESEISERVRNVIKKFEEEQEAVLLAERKAAEKKTQERMALLRAIRDKTKTGRELFSDIETEAEVDKENSPFSTWFCQSDIKTRYLNQTIQVHRWDDVLKDLGGTRDPALSSTFYRIAQTLDQLLDGIIKLK